MLDGELHFGIAFWVEHDVDIGAVGPCDTERTILRRLADFGFGGEPLAAEMGLGPEGVDPFGGGGEGAADGGGKAAGFLADLAEAAGALVFHGDHLAPPGGDGVGGVEPRGGLFVGPFGGTG